MLTQVAARPTLNSPSLLADGSVLLSGTGSPGVAYEVQTTTSLAHPPNWVTLGTIVAQTDGSLSFVHAGGTATAQAYYRLHTP